MARYIFVAGGVMSGIGKGITTASIGKILQSKGFKVTAIKIDPYVNVDAGTMNPVEHGEVFVTKDGLECDQDIGNYERFLGEELTDDNYLTTGRVYQTVINKERSLEYNGKCVEVVPHIPNEVIAKIKRTARKTKADFVLIEIGGTVGEYQNLLFLEAARMMKLEKSKNVIFVLVSYLPVPKIIGEMKTKPTQYAVRTLNSAGIQPDIIIARSEAPLDEPRKNKISVFCNVRKEDVISAPDIGLIYEVPINFEKDNLGKIILNKFGIKARKKGLDEWEKMVNTAKSTNKKVKIAIIGKYFQSGSFFVPDSYISIIEAVKHSSWFNKVKPELSWLSSSAYEKNPEELKKLKNFDGVIIPGGFGKRGLEGKIKAIQYCREKKIPFLGICLGMQLAVIEFGRNVCNLKNADSVEFNPKTKYPLIDLMPEQKLALKEKKYGKTMRLGNYKCLITKNSRAYLAYLKHGFNKIKNKKGDFLIEERHRHRYEFNNEFKKIFEEKGLVFSGINPEKGLVEIIEIPDHPFFIAGQFHPEFKSNPLSPHPLFNEFIRSAIKNK